MKKNDDATPLPGKVVPTKSAQPIISTFRRKYRHETGQASNIPTACTIEGAINKKILDSPFFLKKKKIYALIEQPPVLRETSTAEIRHYMKNKQPWEEYDICLFDTEMKWAIGITHNDYIIVNDESNTLNTKHA